jgi:hypothetical protein
MERTIRIRSRNAWMYLQARPEWWASYEHCEWKDCATPNWVSVSVPMTSCRCPKDINKITNLTCTVNVCIWQHCCMVLGYSPVVDIAKNAGAK